MKKTLLFLLLICIAIPNAHAQKYNVFGLIVNKFTYEKIDSVTVRFLNADSTEVERFVSKDEGRYNGNFSCTIKAPGKYILHFSKPGYEDTYKTVNFRYKKYRITGGYFRPRADEERAEPYQSDTRRSHRYGHAHQNGDEGRHPAV